MTPLETWLEKIKKSNEFDAPHIDANKAIAVIEKLKEALEEYRYVSVENRTSEYGTHYDFVAQYALAIDPEKL